MRSSIAATGGLALAIVLVLTGCGSDVQRAEIAATQARIAAEQSGAAPVPSPPAGTPGAAQVGANLAGFDLVFGTGDGFVGRYVRTGPGTWEGPDLVSYQPVAWTATTTTPERLVLTKVSPADQTLDINVSNGQVSSGSLDPSFNYRLANQVYQ